MDEGSVLDAPQAIYEGNTFWGYFFNSASLQITGTPNSSEFTTPNYARIFPGSALQKFQRVNEHLGMPAGADNNDRFGKVGTAIGLP